jgi:hypothetical protein
VKRGTFTDVIIFSNKQVEIQRKILLTVREVPEVLLCHQHLESSGIKSIISHMPFNEDVTATCLRSLPRTSTFSLSQIVSEALSLFYVLLCQ